jgi:hypothetical protein
MQEVWRTAGIRDFLLGSPGSVTIDESSVLIEKENALEQKQKDMLARASVVGMMPAAGTASGTSPHEIGSPLGTAAPEGYPLNSSKVKKRFFATKELNPQKARLDFNEVLEDVLMKLTARHSTAVSISVEILAQDSSGFTNDVQETLKSACDKLNFNQSGFADD